jgi:hypothetical protein
MSQLKRNSSQFRCANTHQPSGTREVDHVQPHQTLTLQPESTPWPQRDARGGDPYNAAGKRMIRQKGS